MTLTKTVAIIATVFFVMIIYALNRNKDVYVSRLTYGILLKKYTF